MTSLERIKIVHHNPEIYFEIVDAEFGGDPDLAYQVKILEKVFMGTRGLTRLTSLLIDGDERIGLRSTFSG